MSYSDDFNITLFQSLSGLLLNPTLSPPSGAAARVVRACGRLRAVRRQRSGGDRHAAASGASSVFRLTSCLQF